MNVEFGVAGWSYTDWAGVVHPPGLRGGAPLLRYMAKYVDLLEINTSFYRPVPREQVERWAVAVAPLPNLQFVVKVWGRLSHEPWHDDSVAEARTFAAAFLPFVEAGRLRAWLIQLPAGAADRPAERMRLAGLRTAWPEARLALEVRHRSWFEADALSFLAGEGLHLVHIDLPPARDHPPEPAPIVGELGYLRLHGRNAAMWFDRRAGRDDRYDWLYGPAEVEALLARLRTLAAGTKSTLLVANNHPHGKAVATVLEMRARYEDRPVPAPASLVERYPHLAPYVVVEGQQGLFL